MIPEILEDWNTRILEEMITKKINESDRHDFKYNLPDSETLIKICCAFANTKGGFIVLGIKQHKSNWDMAGIDNSTELARDFGHKITNTQPSLHYGLPLVLKLPDSEKVIAIFDIPVSDERPHISSTKEKRIFWKRTNRGNEEMTYEEIRMSFQRYEERREKIKLLHIELFINLQTLYGIRDFYSQEVPDNKYFHYLLDPTIIMTLLTDLFSILGKDTDLIKSLIIIRKEFLKMNLENNLFNSKIIYPQSNLTKIVKEHNNFTNTNTLELIPYVENAINLIETNYHIKNPLELS